MSKQKKATNVHKLILNIELKISDCISIDPL